jgi:hypothetical protein
MVINAGIEKVIVRINDTEYKIIDVQDEWVDADASLEIEGGY